MIQEENIISLLRKAEQNRSETTEVEFKDARGGLPSDTWKTISSFSHKPNGGLIIFGVYEDRINNSINIVGGLDIAVLQEKITSLINDKMRNVGKFDFKIIEYKDKTLLVLIIDETPNEKKPCYNYHLSLPRGACVREGNTDRTITDDEMRSFIRNSSVFKYDKQKAESTSINDLDLRKIGDFLRKSAIKTARTSQVDTEPTNEIMKNIGVIDLFDQSPYPTIAGYLIFSQHEPQTIRPYTRYVIRCVRYQGDSAASSIIDSMDVSGTLDYQIDATHKFILRNIPKKARISGTKRVEQYEYPEDAIRELVANAVIHRDYMITETHTQVAIFSNRIEISNPGNLPPGVTIENIKDSQFSRNEIIAEILKDMDYLEEYGRGIDIVFSEMQSYGLLAPLFKNMSNIFKVTLLGEHFIGLNDRQLSIWNYLQTNKTITSKICKELFPSVSRQTLITDLNKLVDLGLIIQKGAASSTYYEGAY